MSFRDRMRVVTGRPDRWVRVAAYCVANVRQSGHWSVRTVESPMTTIVSGAAEGSGAGRTGGGEALIDGNAHTVSDTRARTAKANPATD